ncbi:MAG: hypothetical protein GX166_02160 [Clostridiaceae bacterium]|nr:hypothetical protein [Clostridiaceae bacterium]
MDKVVAEVVIGALVLSLLIFIIPLYRQNSDLLNTMAEKADYSEKIKEVMLPNLRDGSRCLGADVISTIRYYELKGGAVIRVWDRVNGSCVYEGEAYDPDSYSIDPQSVFEVRITRSESAGIVEIVFTSVE